MKLPYMHMTHPVESLVVITTEGLPVVLDPEHPRYADILDYLQTADVDPEDLPDATAEVTEMVNTVKIAFERMRALSDRVSIKGETVYFDGDAAEGPLADHILAKINSGDGDWGAVVNFWENLESNPAKHVRKRLYEWISNRGLVLTPAGHVIGYKGVQNVDENLSHHSGDNVVWVDGVEHTGHIPNPVGAVLTMSRSEVDNDRDAACSQGLHVGTFKFARSFGYGSSKVLAVSFNPRDVIAIPRDEGYAKIRVCRYVVLTETDAPLPGTTYADAAPEPTEPLWEGEIPADELENDELPDDLDENNQF